MGSFVNTLFSLLLGWFQAAVSTVWALLTNPEEKPFWTWFGRNWILCAAFLCIAGLVIDFTVYLFRWQPYKVWGSFFRRMTNKNRYAAEAETESRTRSLNSANRAETPEPVRETAQEVSAAEAVYASETASSSEAASSSAAVYSAEAAPRNEVPAEEPVPAAGEPAAPARRRRRSEAYRESVNPAAEETVTRSGYAVPADSPYRRPVSRPASESFEGFSRTEQTERNLLANRRRIRISEFFSDQPESRMRTREPQELIDPNEAYHKPVYPKRWREPEDSDE